MGDVGFGGKTVVPRIVSLARNMCLNTGQAVELECPRATIFVVAFRIRTSGTVEVLVEERAGESWEVTGKLKAEEGVTIWHHMLKHPEFRLRLYNTSSREVWVSVDVNLPCYRQVQI